MLPLTVKAFCSFLFLAVLVTIRSYGQRITTTELVGLCNKPSWENINEYLLNNSWNYYESKKGDSEHYNTITWSFGKDDYSDKALAWLYVYTYDKLPVKLRYEVYNAQSYLSIQNTLVSNGFKTSNSEVYDDEIISSYINSFFKIDVATQKRARDKDDSFANNSSLTAYHITLTKRSSIYDPNNGKKIQYYEGTENKKAEYILKDGKMFGQVVVYHENGQVKRKGNYIADVGNGKFVEYDEGGELTREYIVLNDQLDGEEILYENGKRKEIRMMKKGKRSGPSRINYYLDNTDEIIWETGSYFDDKKNGEWLTHMIKNGKQYEIEYTHYLNGIRNGRFQDISGDSLFIGTWNDDLFDGDYKIYVDEKRKKGEILNPDTAKLILLTKGKYKEGIRVGNWKFYDLSTQLRREGSYVNGQEEGVWKYYYTQYKDSLNLIRYSGALYCVSTFHEGKQNGKETFLSVLETKKVPCNNKTTSSSLVDSCYQEIISKDHVEIKYKNDLKDGPYSFIDSAGNVLAKGNYLNGEKEGTWVNGYHNEDRGIDYILYLKGNYSNGKMNGEFVQYVEPNKLRKTFNFKDDKLNGESIVWNKNKVPRESYLFKEGTLYTLVIYDSLGERRLQGYEIFGVKEDEFKIRYRVYGTDSTITREYLAPADLLKLDPFWFEFTFLLEKANKSWYPSGLVLATDKLNRPLIEGNYEKEVRVGKWTYYYYDQDLKEELTYNPKNEKYFKITSNALFEGIFYFYDQESKLTEGRSIKNGLRNGKTIFTDSQGKLIRKEVYKDGVRK